MRSFCLPRWAGRSSAAHSGKAAWRAGGKARLGCPYLGLARLLFLLFGSLHRYVYVCSRLVVGGFGTR